MSYSNELGIVFKQLKYRNFAYYGKHVEKSISELEEEPFERWMSLIENAICFNVGEFEQIKDIKPIPELIKLPYPICWFECNLNPIDRLGILAFQHDDSLNKIYFYKYHETWCVLGEDIVSSKDFKMTHTLDCTWQFETGDYDEDGKGIFDGGFHPPVLCLRMFVCALSALNCSNVFSKEHKPSKLKTGRAKKKGLPIFSTWTLHVKSERKKYDPQGGTHASPRVHLRRGHARQYEQGKYTWVQPCLVRGQSPGMIHKDYAICSA